MAMVQTAAAGCPRCSLGNYPDRQVSDIRRLKHLQSTSKMIVAIVAIMSEKVAKVILSARTQYTHRFAVIRAECVRRTNSSTQKSLVGTCRRDLGSWGRACIGWRPMAIGATLPSQIVLPCRDFLECLSDTTSHLVQVFKSLHIQVAHRMHCRARTMPRSSRQ